MKISELNWRLIILTSVGVAASINILILLLMLPLFYFEIFSVTQVLAVENYFLLFSYFSPLIASVVSSSIITFFRPQKKLLHTILSTFLTFALTVAILFTVTFRIGMNIYLNFDQRLNQ
jgi:hypothetical protein